MKVFFCEIKWDKAQGSSSSSSFVWNKISLLFPGMVKCYEKTFRCEKRQRVDFSANIKVEMKTSKKG